MSDKKKPSTLIGLHCVKNLFGNKKHFSLFKEHFPKEFAKEYGIKLDQEINKFGADLTDVQMRIMEGILHGFSNTQYRGNLPPKSKVEHSNETYHSGVIPESYKYIESIPIIRASQVEILEWAGVNKKSIGEVERALDALKNLGTNQYCFYYIRLALNDLGDPITDKDGDLKKEEVMLVDTLFKIRTVRDEKSKTLKYYEISPSSIFLDQRERYFMMIPFNWREEVKNLVGQRKASSYTFRFLLFLCYQFELRRRFPKGENPYLIKWTPEDISVALKIPPSVYLRKKDRMHKILDCAYSTAQQLGYLKEYKREKVFDVLLLNQEKYYTPSHQEGQLSLFSGGSLSKAGKLYDLFNKEKKAFDPKYVIPKEMRFISIESFEALLKVRSEDEIKEVIRWGLGKPYWCNRIGTPSKLRKFFSEAIAEMRTQGEHSEDRNKEIAKSLKERLVGSALKVEVFNNHMEIGESGKPPVCIEYSSNQFKATLNKSLKLFELEPLTN